MRLESPGSESQEKAFGAGDGCRGGLGGIDPHLQMSSHHQSVVFVCVFVCFFSSQPKPPPPKKRNSAAASVDKMLWPTIKTARPRCPSIEILACQRVINSQINSNIKERGIYTRSRRRALNSASLPHRSWEGGAFVAA